MHCLQHLAETSVVIAYTIAASYSIQWQINPTPNTVPVYSSQIGWCTYNITMHKVLNLPANTNPLERWQFSHCCTRTGFSEWCSTCRRSKNCSFSLVRLVPCPTQLPVFPLQQLECKTDHSPPSKAEVTNVQNFISTSYMPLCYSFRYRGNFTFPSFTA